MEESVYSSFAIENDNGFEVSSLVDSPSEISKHYSMSDSFITPVSLHVEVALNAEMTYGWIFSRR